MKLYIEIDTALCPIFGAGVSLTAAQALHKLADDIEENDLMHKTGYSLVTNQHGDSCGSLKIESN